MTTNGTRTPSWLWILWSVTIAMQCWLIFSAQRHLNREKELLAVLEREHRLTTEGQCLSAALLSAQTIGNRRIVMGNEWKKADSVATVVDSMINRLCAGMK